MPTIFHIAHELSQQFTRSKNKKHCAKHIIIELNSLQYPYSKEPIEYALKAAIINLIEENLFDKAEECIAFAKVKMYILENLYRKGKKEKITVSFKGNFRIILNKYKNIFLRRRPSF